MEHHTEILLENPVDETEALESIQEQIKKNPLMDLYERQRRFTAMRF